jgi:hypothetical protein
MRATENLGQTELLGKKLVGQKTLTTGSFLLGLIKCMQVNTTYGSHIK